MNTSVTHPPLGKEAGKDEIVFTIRDLQACYRDAARTRNGLPTQAEAALQVMRQALEESVKLQSHYAMLLNGWDGGKRMQFENADAWLKRLAALASPPPPRDTIAGFPIRTCTGLEPGQVMLVNPPQQIKPAPPPREPTKEEPK